MSCKSMTKETRDALAHLWNDEPYEEQEMSATTLKYFEYKHLPENLQKISKPIGELAKLMDATLPNCPEKSAGMRKLLEAKDCFVRAALEIEGA